MDSPARKLLKQKDYQRHKMFRKMARKRKAKAEQEQKVAEKALKRKLKLPKYDDGKPNLFKRGDRYFYQESPESKEISVTPINTTFDNPAYWTYQDAEGRMYTPKQLPTSDPGEIKPAEQKNVLESALDNYVGELKYDLNNNVPVGGKYTMPAIAASALLPLAGEAVAPVLANPYVDAGLTSIFAGHGLNHVINEGINGYGDAAMTALEIAPLGRLVRPLWQTAANTGTALYNDMYIPYKISNVINKGVKENAVITAYNRNPATKDIGNLWDYQSYLDNVFPNSKVKDVLWHGSTSKNLQAISPEYIGTNTPIKKSVGMYLTPERYTAVGYGTRGDVYPVLLNTENPFITDQFFGGISKNGVNVTKISPEVRSTLLASNDAVIAPKRGEIAFFNPDNALILGSDADVAGFRRFMSKPQITAKNVANTSNVMADTSDFSSTNDLFANSNFDNNKFILFTYQDMLSKSKSDITYSKLLSDKVVDKQIPDNLILIYKNSIIPRLEAARPGYHGGIMYPTIRAHGNKALKDGYTVYPEEVFLNAGEDKDIVGIAYDKTGHISIKDGYDDFALGHEVRHRLLRTLAPTTDESLRNVEAYGDEFIKLSEEYPELADMNMGKEMDTTTYDARRKLLGDNVLSTWNVNLLNIRIDKTSDEAIVNAFENANGYGKKLIETLKRQNKLTPERILALREVLKHNGAIAIPIAVGAATYQNYDHGKSGIHIKPSKRGTFTAAAKRRGMGVQEFARKVLSAPKGKYSSAMRKKANFARVFGGRNY